MKIKFKVIFILIILSCFAYSCGQYVGEHTPTHTTEFTRIITKQPTQTFTFEPTLTPSSTPLPMFSGVRPFFLLYKGKEEGLIIYDAKNFGKKEVDLLGKSVYFISNNFNELVSPDGKWLAFYSHDLDNLPSTTLSLLNLEDNSMYEIAEVIPADSEARLAELTEKLPAAYPQEYPSGKAYNAASNFHTDVDWSPDSRFVAFSGQIDGLSTDVYIYDTETKNYRRLNNDLLNVERISWSPDGKYIAFSNTLPKEDLSVDTLHIIPADQVDVRNPSAYLVDHNWFMRGWLSPEEFIIAYHGDGGSWSNLSYIDADSKEIKLIWPGAFEDFDINVNEREGIISSESGLYQFDMAGNTNLISPSFYWYIAYRESLKSRYIGVEEDKIYGIEDDGESTLLSKGKDLPFWENSPNKKWMVVYDNEKVELFDENDLMVASIPVGTFKVSWNPNSTGFFISNYDELYYVKVPNGDYLLVDQCKSDDCEINLWNSAWLP